MFNKYSMMFKVCNVPVSCIRATNILNISNTQEGVHTFGTPSAHKSSCVEFVMFQEHGLKLYLRDPHSYTPLREPFWRDNNRKSLTLGRDKDKNREEISKFCKKDSKVMFNLNNISL